MNDVEIRHRRYAFTIDGASYESTDPKLKGRDLLERAGRFPVDEYLLFQRQSDGMLEDRNLSEDVDLSDAGGEEFTSVKADRLYFLVVDGRRFPWGDDQISGRQLRELARVSDDWVIFYDPKGGKDDLVDDDEHVSLKGKEVEHFYTDARPTGPVLVKVELDGEKVEILSGNYTTEALKEALGVAADLDLDIVDKKGSFRTLQPGEHLVVVAKMKFVSHVRQGGSS